MNVVYNKDCLEGMKDIESGSIDFIFTDLPYGVLNTSNKHAKWDKQIDMERLWEQYWRILKPDGVVALFSHAQPKKVLEI